MNAKRVSAIFFIVLAVGLLLSVSDRTEAATKWRAGGVSPSENIDQKTLEKWAKLVNEKTGGKLVIDAYPSEQLGSIRDMFDGAVRGTLESTLTVISPEFDKRLLAAHTLYVADTWDAGKKAWGKNGWMSKLLEPVFLDLGVKPLGFFYLGMDSLVTTKGPVVHPEDLKKHNIKMRVAIPGHRLLYQEMGVPCVDVSFGETFTSFQTGLITGQDNSPFVTWEFFRQVSKYYTTTNTLFEVIVLMVNKKVFDSQPPEIQKAIQEAADEALDWGNTEAEKMQEGYFHKMEGFGIKVIRLTPEQRAEWKKWGMKSWDKYEGLIGKKTMDYIRESVRKQ